MAVVGVGLVNAPSVGQRLGQREAGLGRAQRRLVAAASSAGTFGLAWWLTDVAFGLETGNADGRGLRWRSGPGAGRRLGRAGPPGSQRRRDQRDTVEPLASSSATVMPQRPDYVVRLATYLTNAGVPVWYDRELISGHRWVNVIRDRIDNAAAMIVVMTPEGEQSAWVSREIARAEQQHVPILPLLHTGQRFFSLADVHYEDVTSGQLPGAPFVEHLRSSPGAEGAASDTRDGDPAAIDAETGAWSRSRERRPGRTGR